MCALPRNTFFFPSGKEARSRGLNAQGEGGTEARIPLRPEEEEGIGAVKKEKAHEDEAAGPHTGQESKKERTPGREGRERGRGWDRVSLSSI